MSIEFACHVETPRVFRTKIIAWPAAVLLPLAIGLSCTGAPTLIDCVVENG